MTRMLCVRFPRFPVQRQCVRQPELEGCPLVLFADIPRGRFVVTCSPEASRRGVQPGQSLAEAQSWLTNTTAIARPIDPLGDIAELRRLALDGQQFSPLVGIDADSQVLLFDLAGCALLFGGERVLCGMIQAWLQREGYRVRWSLADTIGAAWAFAHTLRHSTLVPIGQQARLSARLPLAALRLSAPEVMALHKVGLRTLGDLAAVPRQSLPGRFGPRILQRWDQLTGRLPESFSVERLREPIRVVRGFEEPITPRLAIDAINNTLLQELLATPRLQGTGVQELHGRFQFEGGRFELPVRLIEPTRDLRHLGNIVRLQLERQVWSGGVSEIRWEIRQAGPLPVEQPELFETGRTDAAPRALSQLVDRLSSRLGTDRVLRVQPVPDPVPERSMTFAPWTADAVDEGHDQHPSSAWHRPLRLLSTPERIEVWSTVPDGPPFRVRRQGRTREITQNWGPERIESGWSQDGDVERDYYRVEVANGPQWWLFREKTSRVWFLQGFFE